MEFLRDLFRLFFPATCCNCGKILVGSEHDICTGCLLQLPELDYFAQKGNPMEHILGMNMPIESAGSLLQFQDVARNVVHEIKYHGNVHLAHSIGRMMGEQIRESHRFDDVDIIVPVPLHEVRQRNRGYNQSEELCRGIVQAFPRKIAAHTLERVVNTQSQTKQQIQERQNNVKVAFAINDAEAFRGKHVLLVDDVLTTGATICSAALPIINGAMVRISVATLAFAG